MKRLLFCVCGVIAISLAAQQNILEHEDSSSLCFDARVVSLSKFQNLDLRAALRAIYAMAEVHGAVDELPQGFLNCLEKINSGDDRVRCCDLIESLKLVLDFLLTMRGGAEQSPVYAKRGLLQLELEAFAQDVTEALWDIWHRLDALEHECGIVYLY